MIFHGFASKYRLEVLNQLDLKEKDSFDTYEIAIDDDEYDIDPEDDAPDESKRTAADYGSLIL